MNQDRERTWEHIQSDMLNAYYQLDQAAQDAQAGLDLRREQADLDPQAVKLWETLADAARKATDATLAELTRTGYVRRRTPRWRD
jgi:hypothetical protein